MRLIWNSREKDRNVGPCTIYVDGAPLQVKTGSKRVSIVQVNYVYDKGLTEPDVLLDRYFTLTGWSEALVRAGAGPVAVVQAFHRDFEVTRNGVDYLFRRAAIPAAVAARRPDIAHVNGLIFPARTWMLRRLLDPASAIVVQNHGDGDAVGRAPFLRLLARAARDSADAFLFAADEHAASWRAAGLIAPDRRAYQVMEASTRLQPVARGAARDDSGVSGSPAILWVGRLNMNKDPLTVLEGFEGALADLPGATLTMIFGTGALLEAVRVRIARSSALRARVRLAGAVPHKRMASFYSAADLFIVGSHHEGSGYALMEACACGAVPVVTGIPTFRLLTGGGAVGALWTPGDGGDCARALVEVARRDLDAERARLADHFARALSWDAVGRRALEIYEDVLSSRVLEFWSSKF
jgi:glycosyltransferase involved in cell wall biosynthesis